MLQNCKLSKRFNKDTQIPKNNELTETSNQDLKTDLIDKIESTPVWSEYTPEKQKELIKTFVNNKLEDKTQKDAVTEDLFESVNGFGPLQNLIDNENVTAIFVNDTKSVHIELANKILNTEIQLSEKQLNFILNTITGKTGKTLEQNIYTCKIDNLLVKVIKISGINISIKKIQPFNKSNILNMLNEKIFDLLINAINTGKNIVIAGDTNSGKTALLEALISELSQNKRSILLENIAQINYEENSLIKFEISKSSKDYQTLLENITKLQAEYIYTDFNEPICKFFETKRNIATLDSQSFEATMSKLTSAYISQENFPEKFAKTQVLSNIDYVVQLNSSKQVALIAELTNAKTMAASIKIIAKLSKGEYIINN